MTFVGYWMNEESGVLRPAIEAYLHGGPLTVEHVAAIRAYFRQWAAGDWGGEAAVEKLRRDVGMIRTRGDVDRWLHDATELGMDPL